MIDAKELLGAIARGWCHPKNSGKEMDPDLAIAIAAEVSALLPPETVECVVTEVTGPDGSPAAAPCVLDGCQYGELERDAARLAFVIRNDVHLFPNAGMHNAGLFCIYQRKGDEWVNVSGDHADPRKAIDNAMRQSDISDEQKGA